MEGNEGFSAEFWILSSARMRSLRLAASSPFSTKVSIVRT